MPHTKVYGLFKKLFPEWVTEDTIYFPNGKDSVRIRNVRSPIFPKDDLVFTGSSTSTWKLETIDNYLYNLRRSLEMREKGV